MSNPQRPNAPYSAPYPQQPGYNMSGPPSQQSPYGSQMPYGAAPGSGSGNYQQNMSAPYGGPHGIFGGIGNPYGQGSNPPPGNPYGASSNPQPGNPYGQSSYPPQGGSGMNAGYPSAGGQSPYGGGQYGQSTGGYPPSGGQPPYGGSQYGQSTGGYGAGGYPGAPSGYPSQPGGYPSSQPGGYPSQPGGYSQQPGGYPQHGGGYPSQGGGYQGQQQGYPSQGGYPGAPYGAPGMGPNAGGFQSPDQRNQRLNQIIQRYEINPQFAARLQTLGNCEIVVLCDDSGSMNATLQGTNKTRWDELKSIVTIVVDIAATMDSNGVDIYFLNRDPIPNVTNGENVRHIFQRPPDGLTPLARALRQIIAAKRNLTYEKKLLILIATDGVPTSDYGQQDIPGLEAVLRNERTPQTYITFLACTDDLESVNYLSRWDKNMPNLDVVDDYASERAEILRTRGGNFPFSFGDYIVKALLGSLDPWFDSLDDRA